jgi:hypothetical protein
VPLSNLPGFDGELSLFEVLSLLYMCFFFASLVSGSYIVEQGDTNWELNGYASSEAASTWYPGGLEENQHFTVAPYTDTSSGDRSVVFHTGADENRQKQLDFLSTPGGASVTLSDDSGELALSQEPEGDWAWSSSEVDGGVVTQGSTWEEMEIESSSSGANLILSSPDGSIDLVDSAPFYLRYNRPPSVDSLDSPADGATVYDDKVQLSATVSDPDDDTLEVTFYNSSSDSEIASTTVSGTAGGTQATVEWDGLLRGADHTWYAVASDDWDSDRSSEDYSFYVNRLPIAYNPVPEDNSLSGETPTELRITARDPEGSDVNVFFINESDDSLIGKSGTDASDTASTEWGSLDVGRTYRWYVNVSDGKENLTSISWAFKRSPSSRFRPTTEIEYDYTHIIATPDRPSHVFFTVKNRVKDSKELNTSLSGVNAEFLEGGWYSKYTLGEESSRRFQVRVEPGKTGRSELKITTRDLNLGLEQTDTIPVYTRNTTSASVSRDVPGIGLYQVAALVLFSAAMAFRSL